MAAIGAVGGMWMATLIGAWLSWLACAVLVALGLRMLVIADDEVITAPVGWAALLALGLATSVHAQRTCSWLTNKPPSNTMVTNGQSVT